MIGRVLKVAFMLTAMAAGCSSGSSAAHYQVRGEARHNWKAAAQQILRGHCEIANPTAQQIESAAEQLRLFGIEEVENSNCWGVLSFDSSTPQGVDIENCGIGSSSGSETSVALPPGICPSQPVPEPQAPAEPDAGKPDAGDMEPKTKDAGTQAVDIGLTPETLDTPVPDAEDTTPEAEAAVPEVESGPSPAQQELEQARQSLRNEISRSGRLINDLNATGNTQMKAKANNLQSKKNAAYQVLHSDDATLEELEAALTQLRNARRSAQSALNRYLESL